MSEPLRLFLVRHGETAWSITGQHTGLTDIALTAHGEDQARALAGPLRSTSFARVLTSPLRRARRTCELAGLGAEAQTDADLVEWEHLALDPASLSILGYESGHRTVPVIALWNAYSTLPGDSRTLERH